MKRSRSGSYKQTMASSPPGGQSGVWNQRSPTGESPETSKRTKLLFERQEPVPCTYCDARVPALKTCLQCDASFCAKHLEKHRALPGHVLTEPTTSLVERKCPKHGELLKYHCVTCDGAYICPSCHVIGLHRGHKVESLEVYAEKKRKSLNVSLKSLERNKQDVEKQMSSLDLQNRSEELKIEDIERKVTAKTKDIIKSVEALERQTLKELSTKKDQLSNQMEELEAQKEEISQKMEAIVELSNLTDPLTFLITEQQQDVSTGQTFSSPPSADMKGLEILETEILQKLQHADSAIRQLLDGGLLKTHTELENELQKKEQVVKLQNYQKELPKKKQEVKLPKKQTKQKVELQKNQDLEVGLLQTSDITLDDVTAHCDIIVSENHKTATNTPKKNKNSAHRGAQQERFKSPHVMSSTSFSSGDHYWEVDLRGTQKCILGVAYRSLVQMPETPFSDIGRNDKSWGLYIEFSEKLIRSCHNRNQVRIPTESDVASFGISLEYEAGRITFYQLSTPRRVLHTFSAIFTEPLHACFYLYRGCIISIRE